MHSDEIERFGIRLICLASPFLWSARTGRETDTARNLRLHFAAPLHGLPMEAIANRQGRTRQAGDSLHAYLQCLSQVAGRWLHRRRVHKLGASLEANRTS